MNQKRLILSFLTLSSLKFPSLKTQQTTEPESFSLHAQPLSLAPTPANRSMAAGTPPAEQAQPPPDKQGSHTMAKLTAWGTLFAVAVTLHMLK